MLTEHINAQGQLLVPVTVAWAGLTPVREGWEAFWVNVNLDGHTGWEGKPQKIVKYRKVSG